MKRIFVFCCLYWMFGTINATSGQVSANDRKLFADNLNAARKITNLGVSAYSKEHVSIELNGIKYNGIRAVSNELMLRAYPNISYLTLLNKFQVLGVNETNFNQFIYQVFLYKEGKKDQVTLTLTSFCGSQQLSTRIFEKFWSKYSSDLTASITKLKEQQKKINDNEKLEKDNKNVDQIINDSDKISTPVYGSSYENDFDAAFPGGVQAYQSFLTRNLHVPDSLVAIEGTVICEFIIDSSGKIKNARIISNHFNDAIEKEVLRVINSLPEWQPARKNNIAVDTIKRQIFHF